MLFCSLPDLAWDRLRIGAYVALLILKSDIELGDRIPVTSSVAEKQHLSELKPKILVLIFVLRSKVFHLLFFLSHNSIVSLVQLHGL